MRANGTREVFYGGNHPTDCKGSGRIPRNGGSRAQRPRTNQAGSCRKYPPHCGRAWLCAQTSENCRPGSCRPPASDWGGHTALPFFVYASDQPRHCRCEKKLAKRGIEILLEENETVDEDEQLASIRRLEETGIDGLAIMPVDSDGIRTKLQQLTRNDLPVITFNTDIVGTGRRCFVGLDNRKSGQTAAGLMGLMTQEQGKILVITGYFSNRTGSLRVDGFVEELKRSFPKMELVGVQSSFDQSKEVEDILVHALEAFPDLAGVFVASGGQAGVRRAFERVQPKKRPYVILYDRTPRNEEQLRDRVADFVIDQEGYEQGSRAVLMLADLLQNHKLPEKEYCYTEISIKTRYNLT